MLSEDKETYQFYRMFLNQEEMDLRYKKLISKQDLSPKEQSCLKALKRIKTENLLNINNKL